MPNKIAEWCEFGHHFTLWRYFKSPDKNNRPYRLYDNGYPARGGQWHYSTASAFARANYVVQEGYCKRIAWLEQRVCCLEVELEAAKLVGV